MLHARIRRVPFLKIRRARRADDLRTDEHRPRRRSMPMRVDLSLSRRRNVPLLSDPLEPDDNDADHRAPTDMFNDIRLCEELFHTSSGVAYADFVTDGHREIWPIRSKRFRTWLRRCYY